MKSLDDEARFAFSRLLKEKRNELGLNGEDLAERAEAKLREALANGYEISTKEREAWENLEISQWHCYAFERFPAYPLQTLARRGRLLGITLALGLEPSEVNRLAGGI